jgi:hypothetical protein
VVQCLLSKHEVLSSNPNTTDKITITITITIECKVLSDVRNEKVNKII